MERAAESNKMKYMGLLFGDLEDSGGGGTSVWLTCREFDGG